MSKPNKKHTNSRFKIDDYVILKKDYHRLHKGDVLRVTDGVKDDNYAIGVTDDENNDRVPIKYLKKYKVKNKKRRK